jgi:hypothetical protein
MNYHEIVNRSTSRTTRWFRSGGPIARQSLRCCLWLVWLVFGPREGRAEVRYWVVQLVSNEEIGALESFAGAGGINRFGDMTGSYTMDMGTNAVAYPYPYESRPFIYRDETGFLSLVETNTPFFWICQRDQRPWTGRLLGKLR